MTPLIGSRPPFREETDLEEVQRIAYRIEEREKDQRTDRAELVRAMKEAYGPHTLQEIGDAAGLSRERVRQLLKE